MTEPLNLRHELRAYHSPNACCLAAILRELCWNAGVDSILRDNIVARWGRLYPQHIPQTGRRTIRNRIVNRLSQLKIAGTAQAQEHRIAVLSGERLVISVDNLRIVQGNQGTHIPPHLWARQPGVPPHLQAVSDQLEESRQATIAAAATEAADS